MLSEGSESNFRTGTTRTQVRVGDTGTALTRAGERLFFLRLPMLRVGRSTFTTSGPSRRSVSNLVRANWDWTTSLRSLCHFIASTSGGWLQGLLLRLGMPKLSKPISRDSVLPLIILSATSGRTLTGDSWFKSGGKRGVIVDEWPEDHRGS